LSASDEQSAAGSQLLLTVVYDSGMDDRVSETLDRLRVAGWTKLFGGHGFGGSGYKQDSPVWPGTVNVLLLVLSPQEAARVETGLRELQGSYRRNPGLTMWTQPASLRG
jgi:hypothetical protein